MSRTAKFAIVLVVALGITGVALAIGGTAGAPHASDVPAVVTDRPAQNVVAIVASAALDAHVSTAATKTASAASSGKSGSKTSGTGGSGSGSGSGGSGSSATGSGGSSRSGSSGDARHHDNDDFEVVKPPVQEHSESGDSGGSATKTTGDSKSGSGDSSYNQSQSVKPSDGSNGEN